MYGHGAQPPTRGAGTVIALRVFMTACALLSCGFFACVPLFRAAFLRGRWYDWLVAWASLVLSVGCVAVIGEVPETDPRSDAAAATILFVALAAAVYYLVVDIGHHNRAFQHAGYAPPHARTAPMAYGYPPAPPYATPPAPMPPPHHADPAAQTYAPAPPPHPVLPQNLPPQPPSRPAPARIDQVRAELDELSDYLRKHDGHEGGR
ncbi:hypothetical protein [Streptomyces sp. LaPpAH-108]|uniref:hypothetical protein n=1 Tax=Streptomyces sp. LaPpAH-108 TaxID=1155714 RepID=UPI00036FA1DF|nr:hypothetical protein [Streptomyces sp. LaPpAH-108]